MNWLLIILVSFESFNLLNSLEFRNQLKGLLPIQIEKFYHQIDRNDLILIDHAFMMQPDNFYAQLNVLMRSTGQKTIVGKEVIAQKLAKQYAAVFFDLYQKANTFDKQLRFFYFWRVIHVLNDLLIYKTTQSNLNKFTADVLAEWNLLSVSDKDQFTLMFPQIVERIKGREFQDFASIGRKLWSFQRFVIPKD